MVLLPVKYPACQSTDVLNYGKQPNSEQRYRYNHSEGDRTTFLLNYAHRGNQPGTKEKIIARASNGCGIGDMAQVLKMSPVAVMSVLPSSSDERVTKTEPLLQPINTQGLRTLTTAATEVILCPVAEAGVDERWSFVRHKGEPRWLWQALAHRPGTMLADGFGNRQDQAFLALKALLQPFASVAMIRTAGALISGR